MSDGNHASAAAAALRRHGVTAAFGTMDPLGSLLPGRWEDAGIPVVRTLHEQTAVFAADAWAKVTRGPGVALVGGRAGLPNAVTGIANAHATGSPVVVVDDRRAPGGADGLDGVDGLDGLDGLDHRAM